MSKKNIKLESFTNHIKESKILTDDEKSSSIKHIEESIIEHRAEGIIFKEIYEKFTFIRPLFDELGL